MFHDIIYTIEAMTPLEKLFHAYSESKATRPEMIHRIAAQFGINRKEAPPLDSQKHASVVQYLLAAGFATSNDKGTDVLTITPVKNTTQDGHITYSNIQVVLSEKHVLEEFCHSEIMTLKKYENTPFVQMRRSVYIPVEAYMPDANMTITYHQETPSLSGEQDSAAGAIQVNWENLKKKYKMSNQVIYAHPAHPFTIELHITRESKYALGANQKMVPVPTHRMSDAGLHGAYEKYEIYLRFNPDIMTSLAIVKAGLSFGSRLILGGIQSSFYPISFPERNAVLQQYSNLFRPGKPLEERRFGGINTQEIPFIGPYPDTIGPEHVTEQQVDADIPNIRHRFTVTDKTDGLRSLLFIAESRKVYMITTSMDVIYTGAKIKDKAFVYTLMDGEFVSHDMHDHPLNLFAVFDIYFDRGSDVRIRPFLKPSYTIPESDIVKDEYATAPRFHLMDHLIRTRLQLVYEHGDCPAPFQLRPKSFYTAESLLDEGQGVQEMQGSKSIFQVCKTILMSKGFEYEIDGLIFTHMDMPVSANRINETEIPFYHKFRWKWALKWKPPNQNSIDFLVKIKKNAANMPVIISEVDEKTQQFARYYVVHLYSGGYEQKDPAETYLFPSAEEEAGIGNIQTNVLKPVLFRPANPSSATAHEARVPMVFVNNEWIIQTEAGELLEDDSIVEFYYDMERPVQYRWRAMVVRYDKTHDYRVIKKRVYGNAHDAAERIWSSIHNPITSEMIMSGEHLPTVDQDLSKVYYNRDGSKIYTEGLRQFHNYYVKKKLLGSVLFRGATLIDYSCGRGGDLNKWVQFQPSFILGIDLSHDNIYNARAGVYARLTDIRRKRMHPPPGLFLQGNSSVPIVTGEIAVQESDRARLFHILGKGAALPKTEVGPILYPAYGIASEGFHVGSCQFSIHYFFKDPATVHAFMRNVAQTIRLGGYFVGTCFDGETVFQKLKPHPSKSPLQLRIDDHVVFRAARKYGTSEFETGAQSLGYPISIFQDSINQDIIEYLVKYDYLKELMQVYGFEVDDGLNQGLVGNGMFRDMFHDLYANRHDPELFHTFQKAISMTEAEREISSWNRWFLFKKVRLVGEAEWARKEEMDTMLYEQHKRVIQVETEPEIGSTHLGPNRPVADLYLDPSTVAEAASFFEPNVPVISAAPDQVMQDELFQLTNSMEDSTADSSFVFGAVHRDREYVPGEPVTLYHAKARRPYSQLASYANVEPGLVIPDKPGVFVNLENMVFPSAEHAFQSQFFSKEEVRRRFSETGDLGMAESGFAAVGKSGKIKEEWIKRNGTGVIAYLAMQTKASRKKLQLVPDIEPANIDSTWLYILQQKFARPEFQEILKSTGDTYLLEKDEAATAERGGVILGDELQGKNQMGKYLMAVRASFMTKPVAPVTPVVVPPATAPAHVLPAAPATNITQNPYAYTPAPIPPSEQYPTEKNDIRPVSRAFLEATFPDVPGVDRTKLLMTNQGEFSVSKTEASTYLRELIRIRTGGKPGIRVTDATGSVGSDSIALGLQYAVNSIEMSPAQVRVIAHNIHLYGAAINVQLYHGDSLDIIPLLQQDVIYMDAPWGGRNYKDTEKMQLFMSGMEIAEVYNRFHQYSQWMIFKVPKNYDHEAFRQTCTAPHQEVIPFYKKDRISFYYIVCSELNGPKNLPKGKTTAATQSFYQVDAAYNALSSYVSDTSNASNGVDAVDEDVPLFEMSTRALQNTLDYTMNVLFQTGFMVAVAPGKAPVMFPLRTRTTDLESRVYVPFVKQLVERLRSNRAVTHAMYNRIQKIMAQPYRLMGGIVKDLKDDVDIEMNEVNEYEQFMTQFQRSFPPGLYYFNLSDTVIVREDGAYPFPNIIADGKTYYQKPLLPIFSASTKKGYADILIPNYDDIVDALTTTSGPSLTSGPTSRVIDWSKKTDNRAVFRGSGTGEGCTVNTNMRLRLSQWGSQEEWKSWIDARLTSVKGKIKIDAAGICQMVVDPKWVGEKLTMEQQSAYKYIIHIDGNVAAYRLLKTMQLGSLVLRVKSEYKQWADKYLKAGEHYIEVAADLSDLKSVLEYCRAHEAECARIASNGKQAADRLRLGETLADGLSNALQSV